MERKRSQPRLATLDLKLNLKTDSDGDIIVEIVEVANISAITEDLAYIAVHMDRIYGAPDEDDVKRAVLEAIHEKFDSRPNRAQYQ